MDTGAEKFHGIEQRDKKSIAAEILKISGEIDDLKGMLEYLEFRFGTSTKPDEVKKIQDIKKVLDTLERRKEALSSQI